VSSQQCLDERPAVLAAEAELRRDKKNLIIVGVPWSLHELAPAVRDADALGSRIQLVDTPEMLAQVERSLDIGKLPVARLALPEIVEALDGRGVDGVVSITEMTMGLAAQVREALGHHGTSSRSERQVSDKLLTRQVLAAHGLTRTGFWESSLDDLPCVVAAAGFPVVVKPRSLTGSTGVHLIESASDLSGLEALYIRGVAADHGRDRLLVETFIAGEEVSAEAVVVDGNLTLLAVTDKINTGPPHFYELGHIMPSRHSTEWWARIADYLQRVVEALDIVTSPIHAELKLAGAELELVEIHSRFGGDNIVRLLEHAFGLRAFETYFAGLLDGRVPESPSARQVCGTGFFTGRLGQAYRPASFGFPHPGAVVEIDFSARRQPKIDAYEGVKLTYWRLGHCLFAAHSYGDVFDNVSFVAECLSQLADPAAGEPG
jgi:predicted ATP-grasp superfamily ATP-dependent carboligase